MAVILFTWASYHQYKCHSILANLRRHRSQQQNVVHKQTAIDVGIPQGDWFQFVSCPHYLAEVIIYSSLLLVQWTMLLPCLFVVALLSLSARQMHSWYCDKFEEYPRDRKRLIPYIF